MESRRVARCIERLKPCTPSISPRKRRFVAIFRDWRVATSNCDPVQGPFEPRFSDEWIGGGSSLTATRRRHRRPLDVLAGISLRGSAELLRDAIHVGAGINTVVRCYTLIVASVGVTEMITFGGPLSILRLSFTQTDTAKGLRVFHEGFFFMPPKFPSEVSFVLLALLDICRTANIGCSPSQTGSDDA